MKRRILIVLGLTMTMSEPTVGQRITLKGFIVPPVTISRTTYGNVTAGFEWKPGGRASVGVTLNAWVYSDQERQPWSNGWTDYNAFAFSNVIIEGRLYSTHRHELLNDLFAGVYGIVSKYDVQRRGGCKNWESGVSHSGAFVGPGVIAGKRVSFSRVISLDVGAGVAAARHFYKTYRTGPNCIGRIEGKPVMLVPRGLLVVGIALGSGN